MFRATQAVPVTNAAVADHGEQTLGSLEEEYQMVSKEDLWSADEPLACAGRQQPTLELWQGLPSLSIMGQIVNIQALS